MPDNNSPAPTQVSTPVATDAGLDVPFAQLFGGGQPDVPPTTAPNSPEPSQNPPATDPAPVQTVDQPPQLPSTSQSLPQAFELKTKTGTVYKSIDDAITGIEHKDTLISQLRQFAMERTGIDPLTGQPVTQPNFQQPQYPQQIPPQTQQQNPQGEGYLKNPQKYFQDLYQAYANNDPQAYFTAQQRLIEEKMQAEYAPFVGMLMEQSRATAVSKVSNEVQDFGKFYNSNAYRETLQKFPALANAIQVSENNAQYVGQLGDLYKMVYQLHQAATLPELIKQQQAAITPPAPPRPTLQQTSITPPQTMAVPAKPNLTDADQRRAVIEAFEKSGKADASWRR